VTITQFRTGIMNAVRDVDRHHVLVLAAGLSYYFVMALFPALILFAALVAYLPIPDLFNQALDLMGRFVPVDSMGLVRKILADVVSPGRGAFLSFGIIGTLWALSGGFSAMMDALNVSYDVPETRRIWHTRPLALLLAAITGTLFIAALALIIAGPRLGERLANHANLSAAFVAAWPFLQWSITIVFAVLAIELLYYLGPNVKQRFGCTLPGAIVALVCWLALSYLLGIYFRSFAAFNKTYGSLGGAVALMVWLYWSGFAILLGAEINAELVTACGAPKLPLKEIIQQSADAETAGADLAA
jgi:membrane protein